MTCKWCKRVIEEFNGRWVDCECPAGPPLGLCGIGSFLHEPAEPSTEGTQAAQPQFGFFRCLSCGFNGTISNDEIAKHRVQCSHGATVPMSQAEWEARGEPAPVAQVDAGKIVNVCSCKELPHRMQCEYFKTKPAVAQTESRPIPAASDCIMDFPQAFAFIAATAADENIHHPKCSYRRARMLCDCSIVWAEYYKRQVASLTQRLQEQEAREAELEEILDGSLHKYGTAVIASESREAELNVEVASLTYRNEIAVSAASEWSKRNSVLRQQNRGKNEKLVALQAQVASLTQRLQASEAREAELKAEIERLKVLIGSGDDEDGSLIWRSDHEKILARELSTSAKRHDDRMEALERSHKALLEMLKDAYNPNPDRPTLRSELESVLAAAEKL